ncbi:hypothetical protein [Candidatus Cryosericum odellii]|uniref:hypothetical protein n=1 Tax=Candidatus Cryosericum odellii TaxID=2290917 RepID=UPI001401D873|nr:hypothetical protein [Candidatus Cryosericum odellii]
MSLNAEELFSERALSFRPSEIRELLKLVDSPEIISLAGGMPDDRFFPIDRVIEASTFALREYGKKALQYGSTEGIKKLRVLLMDRMEKGGGQRHRSGKRPHFHRFTAGSQPGGTGFCESR